jgi:hypothetical protein
MLDVQYLGGFMYAPFDFGFGGLAKLKPESHIVVHAHMRVQRVILENHRDVAVFGGYIVHELVAYVQLTFGNFLQTGDHTQSGGLAATGGADKDDEFLICDIQVKIGDGHKAVRVFLYHVFKF